MKVKSKKGRGGFVTNMEYRNITGKNVKYGYNLTMKYPYVDNAEDADDPKMPVLENYCINNLKCDGVEFPIIIEGIEGCTFNNIVLEDVELLNSKNVATVEFAENINMNKVTIK